VSRCLGSSTTRFMPACIGILRWMVHVLVGDTIVPATSLPFIGCATLIRHIEKGREVSIPGLVVDGTPSEAAWGFPKYFDKLAMVVAKKRVSFHEEQGRKREIYPRGELVSRTCRMVGAGEMALVLAWKAVRVRRVAFLGMS
jgi:hypothetical protein